MIIQAIVGGVIAFLVVLIILFLCILYMVAQAPRPSMTGMSAASQPTATKCWKTPSSDRIYEINAQGGVCHVVDEQQYSTRCGPPWSSHKVVANIPGSGEAKDCS